MVTLTRHIYLASRSARRREILAQMGVRYEVLLLREGPARGDDFDESPLPDEAPADYVQRLARLKAEVGWTRLLQRRLMKQPILSADTTVALDGQIMAKPTDRADAVRMLQALSDRTHDVHTAIAIKMDDHIEVALSSTQVTFTQLSDDIIRSYVATGEPMDKAGAYGIQGKAALFVKHISGSHSGVVGLPVFETSDLLARFGCKIL
ncbi:MAG: Maf family protein [Betaproteobacteria bacterium]